MCVTLESQNNVSSKNIFLQKNNILCPRKNNNPQFTIYSLVALPG